MNQKHVFFLVLTMLSVIVSGCGPKAEQSIPAAAWTPIPTQIPATQTHTPISTPSPTIVPTPTISVPTVPANDVLMIIDGELLISQCPITSASASIVWVEPGPEEGSIAVLGKVPPEYLQVLGLSASPDLIISLVPVLTSGGFKGQDPFSFGTKFYGGVSGPVHIAGQYRRNMNGATVAAWDKNGSRLSESDILFGQTQVDCSRVMFDLDPPYLAYTPAAIPSTATPMELEKDSILAGPFILTVEDGHYLVITWKPEEISGLLSKYPLISGSLFRKTGVRNLDGSEQVEETIIMNITSGNPGDGYTTGGSYLESGEYLIVIDGYFSTGSERVASAEFEIP